MHYCHFNIWLLFFSLSVMSNSLQSHRLQNARLFCPPLSSWVCWIHIHWVRHLTMLLSSHLILCHPILLLPSVFPSIRAFSSESVLHIRWQKYWSFNFSISPFNEYSGLISFRIYWFDLLAVQGSLKSLLQYHNLKASVLPCAAFFTIQLESYDKPR